MPRRPYVVRTFAALLIGCLALAPLRAAAQQRPAERSIAAAARLYESLEFERALELLGRAKTLPDRTTEDDVAIALFEGILLAELGRNDPSVAAFKEALYLNPDAKLPVTVSPKLDGVFEGVRTQVKKQLASGEVKRTSTDRPASTDLLPRQNGDNPQVVAEPEHGFPVRRVVPVALGGLSIAAAGGGAFFGILARDQVVAARASHYQDDVVRSLNDAQQNATIANVAFGIAAVAAIGAAVTYFMGSTDEAGLVGDAAGANE
jgi:tetratricopeptide (TPR) repeat protein